MSNIYIQEPPSNGKVLLTTTLGDIDIELWSKETPKASRNFVQLCMEGYYDNTIFHRVEKGFIAQGGDPTGTGTGGESIYGKSFKDEFHQRLKFIRRGLVAMANAGADDNGSQFFFTLAAAEELNKKHTIFGKVTGNTLYNMIRFNDIDVDEDSRPFVPPKILKTQVLSNPFDDIEPRVKKLTNQDKGEKDKKKTKSKSKATKNYKLLSFGEEAEDDEVETDQATKDLHIKSSHDVLNDPKLSSVPALNADGEVEHSKLPTQKKKDKIQTMKEPVLDDEDESEDEQEKKSKKKKRKLTTSKESVLEKPNGDDINKETIKKDDAVDEFMVQLLQERKEFRKKQKSDNILKKGGKRQDQTLELLANFQMKVDAMSSKSEADSTQLKDDSWMAHKLEFVEPADDAKDANMKGDDWYEIFDPRNPVNVRKRDKSTKDDGKQVDKQTKR